MSTTVLQENLYTAAHKLATTKDESGRAIIPSKSQLPVLTHILIRTENGEIALYATNLDEMKVVRVPARVENEFETCVPAKTFHDWLEVAPDMLSFEYEANIATLHIRGGNSHCQVKCIDAQEFPPTDNAEELETADAPTKALLTARSKDEMHPDLMKPMYFDGKIIACDNYRIHVLPSDKPEKETPYKDRILSIWQKCQPTYTVIVDADQLLKAVQTFKNLAKDGASLHFQCNGHIEIAAESDTGTSKSEIPVLNSTGGNVSFALDYKFVVDALKFMIAGIAKPNKKNSAPRTVTIRFTSENKPVIFENADRLAYVMPKLTNEIPDAPKPTKSELMSAYNRTRAEYRKHDPAKLAELNAAFGKLQSKDWRKEPNTECHTLMTAILARRTEHAVEFPAKVMA